MEYYSQDEMEHYSKWYNNDRTLKRKYNLELDIYKVIDAICNIYKDEQDPCIKLIKFIVDKDIFFKLYDNKSIFQLLLDIPNQKASVFYRVKCGWGFGNLTYDLLKMSHCLVKLNEEPKILDETKNIELIKKFKISGILDYINMEDPIIKEMLDKNGTNGNDITLEKLFSYKEDNSKYNEWEIFKNMREFVSKIKSKINPQYTYRETIPGKVSYIIEPEGLSKSSESGKSRSSSSTKNKRSKISKMVKSFRKTLRKGVVKGVVKILDMFQTKPREDITRIGGNYKRNRSRKYTSRRNIKSLRVKIPHGMVKSYKRKN
jgi:hypothetical protein